MNTGKIITVPRAYKVILKNGDFGTFRNDNGFDNYEERLLSDIYSILTPSRTTQITPDSVLRIEECFSPQGCEHCKYNYSLHPGENVCPKCGERTLLPAVETSDR